MKNQIISVILGIILLSSVAAVLPVSAYDTNSWCNWRGSFFRDCFVKNQFEVTLICEYSGGKKSMSKSVSVENLPYETTSNDDDMDGIKNDFDDCPNDPGIENGWKDSDGCPYNPPWEDAAASSMVDGMQPFFCHWTFPWTVGPGFREEHYPDFSDGTYSNVMPAINAWGNQFGGATINRGCDVLLL